MKIKRFIVFFVCSLVFNIAFAQGYNKDSIARLVQEIRKTPVDTGHIRKLYDLGYEIGEKDSSLSKEILTEALSKSISVKDDRAIANSCRMLGLWYSGVNERDKALEYYRASANAAEHSQLLYLMAGAYFNIGNIKYWKGEYDSCIDYFLKTQEIFENPKVFEDKTLTNRILDKKKSDLYSNISSVFNTLKNLPKADEYIDKSLAIAEGYKSTKMIAYYSQQKADNYYENGEVERALRTRLSSLAQLEKEDITDSYLQSYCQLIAQEYFELGKTDSSKLFALKSLKLAEELEVPDAAANANWQMGKIAMKEKNYKLAETYFQKCSDYYINSEDPTEKRNYYDVQHQLLFATGRYREAYLYLDSFKNLNDTILNGERTVQFSEREAKYQSEKKDTQIKLQKASLQQKSQFNIFLAAVILSLLLIGFLIFRNYKQKQNLQQQRISELETEKQLMATEAVLKGEEQERSRLAKDLHDGLGGMLSGIKYSLNTMKGNLVMTPENQQSFERSIDMLDSSIKEMRRVAHNMMPEALVKFGLDTALKDFCNDINQSGAIKINYQSIGLANEDIEQTTAITIYRIVQELINNTLKHSGAANAIVQVSKTNGILSVTVEDDGTGFDTSRLNTAGGIGWSNIRNRVEFLKGRIDVNSHPGVGTSVLIELNA